MSEIGIDVQAHRDWLLSLLPVRGGAAIVDLGCGNGSDLIRLAARHPESDIRFVGIDASEKSIAAATEKSVHDARIQFQHDHLKAKLPFTDGSFDIVYSNNLLECMTSPEGFAREIARVLRPGGKAVIAHWDWDSQLFDGTDKARVRLATAEDCDGFLHEQGTLASQGRNFYSITGYVYVGIVTGSV